MSAARKLVSAGEIFDFARFEMMCTEASGRYRQAFPFPHTSIDQFLKPDVATEAFQKFPSLAEMEQLKDMRQAKAQDPGLQKFDPIFKTLIFDVFNSSRFISGIETLTGVKGLMPDDELYAAGLAQGGDGSYLNIHIDNSSHPTKALYRRVNLIVYLNKNWNESKGGHIEFWDSAVKKCDAILPAFNRAAIFTVSQQSWHGYRRVNTPDGDTRKSINLYYFTKESPTGEHYYHVTSFRARPGEWFNRIRYPVDNWVRSTSRILRRKKDSHATLYRK